MEIIKTDINTDKDWKDFISHKYNLFSDPEFLKYNDVFEKNIKWHHLKFKADDKNKFEIFLTGCEVDTEEGKFFISCNGASFGGMHWIDKLDLINFNEAITDFKNYLIRNNFKKGILRNQPDIYDQNLHQEYEYALLNKGFEISAYSITNIIQLEYFDYTKLANPLKRTIRNCEKNITVSSIEPSITNDYMKRFYDVLYKNRAAKKTNPTHSLEELLYLKEKIGNRIHFFSAELNSDIIGICVLFTVKSDIALNFYLATDEAYKKFRAADYLLYKSIEWSKQNGYRLYDIGTSDANGTLIEGLFNFKKKFLANGFMRKTYLINL